MRMTIGKLAAEGGVGVETVRYYQRRGLMDTPVRPGGEGWGAGVRHYGEDHLGRLKFIRSAKAAGFTLDEIATLLELDGATDRGAIRELTLQRVAALDEKIAELKRARTALEGLARECASHPQGNCPILEAFEV